MWVSTVFYKMITSNVMMLLHHWCPWVSNRIIPVTLVPKVNTIHFCYQWSTMTYDMELSSYQSVREKKPQNTIIPNVSWNASESLRENAQKYPFLTSIYLENESKGSLNYYLHQYYSGIYSEIFFWGRNNVGCLYA